MRARSPDAGPVTCSSASPIVSPFRRMISAYLLSWSERTSSRYPSGAAGTGRKNRRSLD